MTLTEPANPLASDELFPPFTLKVGMDASGDPRIWACICAEEPLLEWIKEHKVSPYVLYVVWKDGKQIKRYMSERVDHVTHMVFPMAGDFTIEAMLVWPTDSDKSFRQVRSMLLDLASRGRGYENDTHISYDTYEGERPAYQFGESYWVHREDIYGSTAWSNNSFSVNVSEHSSFQPVTIDANLFAKEPRAITKWWVGMFFPQRQFDQCRMRGKMIASVPLTPLWLPVHYVLKTMFMLLLIPLGLVYGNGFKHIWKPGSYGGFGQMFSGINFKRTAWWYKRKKSGDFDHAERSGKVITAISLAQLFAVIFLIAWPSSGELVTGLRIASIVVGCLIGLACAFLALFWCFDKIGDSKKRADRHRRTLDLEELQRVVATDMSCDIPVAGRVQAQNSRLYVRWWGLKDGRCRPYQQSS